MEGFPAITIRLPLLPSAVSLSHARALSLSPFLFFSLYLSLARSLSLTRALSVSRARFLLLYLLPPLPYAVAPLPAQPPPPQQLQQRLLPLLPLADAPPRIWDLCPVSGLGLV